jgi:hypothetical protein
MKKRVEHTGMPEWGKPDEDQGLFNLKKKGK